MVDLQRIGRPLEDNQPVKDVIRRARTEQRRPATDERGDDSDDPCNLAEWTEFHRQVEVLPEDEREVFNLLWYGELTQAEVAEVLGIAVRTVIRRWQAARVRLYKVLSDGCD
jgi:RNA polymerase sigma factor (sigma-70 family)